MTTSRRVLLALLLLSTSQASFPADVVVQASHVGARLDTGLMQGGGTDDTAVLQSVLDRAADGAPIHLIIDGRALVSGLNIYGNTTIECLAGAGLYLKDGSSRAIIRNAHRSKTAITDRHITVRGCFFNGNRDNQPSADLARPDHQIEEKPSNREADGTFITGLQFLGVDDLIIEDVTLWNIRAFGVLIANANRVAIKNLTVEVDYGGPSDVSPKKLHNTDGLMFKGPLRYAVVDGLKLRTGDDGLAFNADTWPEDQGNLYGPYVGVGPITDVSVNNVHFMDAIVGIRFISARERVDRVTISNVTGRIKGCCSLASMSHWINPSGLGNFGSIVFDNVNLDRSFDADQLVQMKAGIRELERQGGQAKALATELNGGEMPYFSINAHIENLSLRNIVTKVSDSRPILRFGPDARARMVTADLTLLDPKVQAVPLKLDENGYIEQLNFGLRWKGDVSDQGRNPVVSLGGTVRQLNWADTPPMYMGSELQR